MSAELRGCVPKLSYSYARTLVNRAWKKVRESHLWSFNIFYSAWISPSMITTGTVAATTGSPNITFDANAIAAINAFQTANPYVLVTQLQFRVPVGSIYSLIAYNSTTGAAILDTPFLDAGGAALGFQLYQLYYTPPMKDFLGWISIRNSQMFYSLELKHTRAEVDQRDPQRTVYLWPTWAVAWGIDQRGAGTPNASSTLGYPLFELWGQPVAPFTYQCYGIRRGTDLVQPGDTLPTQVGEDCVMALARVYAYEWAEANKDMTPRAQGPDFRYLMGASQSIYDGLLRQYRRQDKEYIDSYYSVDIREALTGRSGFSNTLGTWVASP